MDSHGAGNDRFSYNDTFGDIHFKAGKKLHFKAGQHFTLKVSKTFLISRQAKKSTFQGRSTFYIASQQNISHFKAGKHHYHKIKIEEEHQAIVIIDISMHFASFTYMLYKLMCF